MVICKHKLNGDCVSETCFNAKPRKTLLYGRGYCAAFTKNPNAVKINLVKSI